MARLVVALLCLAVLDTPLAAEAQAPGKVYRIGVLEVVSAASNAANLGAFRRGLRELGYVEGQHFVLEYRSAVGRNERFPDRQGARPDDPAVGAGAGG